MNIYWLEQTDVNVPQADDWLSTGELQGLSRLRFPKRRADWRLGRWTAKNALARYLRFSRELSEIEIRPAPSGAPEVFVSHRQAPATISLTHRDGTAACAVAEPEVLLGCDLEIVEPHSEAFIADYFADEEQALFATVDNRNFLSALLWSAKESALKALQQGLRLDPRSIIVRGVGSDGVPPATAIEENNEITYWTGLEVRHESGRVFSGWWQHAGKLVRSVVSDRASLPPMLLDDHRCPSAIGKHAGQLYQESDTVPPA